MRSSKFTTIGICTLLSSLSGVNAWGDDTEVFFGTAVSGATSQPNVLLVLDTSGSMNTTLVGRFDYNSSTTYSASGGCSDSYVYYQLSSSTGLPDCSSNKIAASSFYCTPATSAFSSTGKYIGNAVGWRKSSGKYAWRANIGGSSLYITCEQDTDTLFPLSGSNNSSTVQWTGTASDNYYTPANSPTNTSYTFYSANYVRYLNDPSQISFSGTRLDAVKSAAKTLIGSVSGVNMGVMRYSSNGTGGMVAAPMQDVTSGVSNLNTAIDDMTASGNTPLSETLYEAYRYYQGGTVLFGATSTPFTSVAGSRTGGAIGSTTYKSPITNSCQKSYIVFLTDGLPNQDSFADALIGSADAATGTDCYSSESSMWTSLGYPSVPSGANGGVCLKEMSRVLHSKDLSGLTDTQTVTTFFIGFGDDVAGGAPQAYLADAAAAGGGTAEVATNADELVAAFDKTVGRVLDTNATFTSPSIAVNAFNKTQVLEDLYVAMFQPNANTHWDGNLKKFKLRNGQIVGRGTTTTVATVSAVGSNGFFTDAARDFWQLDGDTDTNLTTKGGAAHRLPNPYGTGARKVYTYIGSNSPGSPQSLASYPFNAANASITDTLLGTTTSSCSTNIGDPSPCRATLINWTRGDSDGDGDTSENDPLLQMGDPIHSQPAVVIYGNDSAATTTVQKLNDSVVFVATNDGMLHAINVTDGVELWSYVPQEVFGDLKNVYDDPVATAKHYSLDGDIRVLKYDINSDGIVNGSDRVFLYFSQGRGGDRYYALDVTDKTAPKFVWGLGSSGADAAHTLIAVNKSWSTPTLGRININGATQNAQKLVLIFGGGYDSSEDAQGYIAGGDTYGRALYIVDAVKGTVLWHAGPTSDTTADLKMTKMTHAIPSEITVLDTNADGYSDRLYVGDMAGQLWRFDITNGNGASSLVAGGVIASLGEKGKSSPTNGAITDNRSFYNAPDLAKFIVTGGANFYNIAIGSGDRALPKSNVTTQDYFYAIRDYNLLPMTQTQYNSYTPIAMTDLTTVTGTSATTIGATGWKLALNSTEKSLAESITVNGLVLFTTYIPTASGSTTCDPVTGSARAYTLDMISGLKYFTNLYETFNTTGLPSQISILNESNLIKTTESETYSSSSSSSSSSSITKPTGTCLSGVSVLGSCVDFGSKVKTFWQESGAY